ncbi:MAG: elongation factor G [Candidatus Aminicenantes bacterium]|nr:elongation factor G [Candidatus Aminicenantes bacterium]
MNTLREKMRNIGISAHIDSGKTTLTERILFYTKKIHRIHEVRGRDGVGATMDSMELEKERGITITSAATTVNWRDHVITIIDTPGHVDFTIEVERSLRVLDSAILVLCSVGGVQSQTISVDRQLRRYNIPRIVFINKLDRVGANPFQVKDQLRERLGHNAVLMQIPIGLEDKHEGVVDLVTMKAIYFDGPDGEIVLIKEIPSQLKEEAQKRREELLDAASLFSDELMEAILDGRETDDLIHFAVRKGTVNRELIPVFMGSAYRNKGVQPLLDAVVRYLPNPDDVANFAKDMNNDGKEVRLESDSETGAVALAFKLEDGPYGQLTYIRIYQGEIKKGDKLYNTRSQDTFRVGRLVKIHADTMADIPRAVSGDIAALFGIECHSGDTFVTPGLNYSLTSIFVPDPVISLAVQPVDTKSSNNLAKALNRFTKEDPTFRTYVDPESKQTIIQGMGELHLDVYIERMKREYKAEVETGKPQVAYREAVSQRAEFDHTHKKQTGGAGQFGRVEGYIEPFNEGPYEFVNDVKGGRIPKEFIPSCDKGFRKAIEKGPLIGSPITNVRVVLTDGQYHPVDSSDIAFQAAAREAFRQVYMKAKPNILEPIMKLSVEGPSEFIGNVFSSITQRRGIIISSTEERNFVRVDAEVPLSEMFGYATTLRSLTQGKAEFTMEFLKYGKIPAQIAEALRSEYLEKERKEFPS